MTGDLNPGSCDSTTSDHWRAVGAPLASHRRSTDEPSALHWRAIGAPPAVIYPTVFATHEGEAYF